ncbi:MAG: membrane dipeptidase, partial [Clostridia bacterium]|nr:membrane dipeptidase [Clostridia bacterium]
MHIFDLHADTPSKLFYERKRFDDPTLHLSAGDLARWESSTQVFAFFCRPGLTDDEAYRDFFAMRSDTLAKITPYKGKLTPILSVEDARLLGNSSDRLPCLAECGVRILTLLWRGETAIGGAYDTDVGLTSFGKHVLSDCFELGITPDLSHSSLPAFWEAVEIAEERGHPILATHSNARALSSHPRNLYDEQFLAIQGTGGLVGLCLCPD